MDRKHSGSWRAGLAARGAAVASFVWIGHARQERSTFTGTSLRLDTDGVVVGLGGFEAGPGRTGTPTARNCCSSQEGRLRYQVEGQPVAEIGLQETAYLP